MVLRKITIDMIQKTKNQKEKVLNQKQRKPVHFLVNKTKKFHETVKNSLIM